MLILLFVSCNDSVSPVIDDFDQLYVTLQGTDKVSILNSSTLEIIENIYEEVEEIYRKYLNEYVEFRNYMCYLIV